MGRRLPCCAGLLPVLAKVHNCLLRGSHTAREKISERFKTRNTLQLDYLDCHGRLGTEAMVFACDLSPLKLAGFILRGCS